MGIRWDVMGHVSENGGRPPKIVISIRNMIINQWMEWGALLSGKKEMKQDKSGFHMAIFAETHYQTIQTKLSGYSVNKNGDINQILGCNPFLSTCYLGNV